MSTSGSGNGMSKAKTKIYDEARERFRHCEEWESETRKMFIEDYKFANADSHNGWQWPQDIRRDRDIDQRPCLTVNKVRQHNLQIINDAKQNKPGIIVRATGGGASYESAQVLAGIIRHIEYKSNATSAYMQAVGFQVQAGVGYFRIETDYVDEHSFEQEIKITGVADPLSVYIDPDAKQPDKSDAAFAFIFDTLPRKDFDKKYPKFKEIVGKSVLGDDSGWVGEDYVRIAEYFRKVEVDDTLLVYTDMAGQESVILGSQIPEEMLQPLLDNSMTRQRPTTRTVVEWYLIIGDQIAEEKLWAGKYIPIIPVLGEETIIDGKLDRRGHTRALKDPQRMYNYWTSAAVEMVALQSKVPWIAPAEAIEGFEKYWNTANSRNYSVLLYNAVGDGGEAIAAPARPQPPQMPQAYVSGMSISQQEMAMASGQYDAHLGAPGNERSGDAIDARQRQGHNATYHYIDNLGNAIRFAGKLLLDLIPRIYDTRRVMLILAEDGTSSEISIDPGAKQALIEEKQQELNKIKRIFNPNIGQYEVQADIGPGYGTRRQEAFKALTEIMTQAPAMTSVIGDIMMRAADFPMADEAAERLRRLVPPQALGEGPSVNEQQLVQMVKQLESALADAKHELDKKELELKNKAGKTFTDTYNAETARLNVVADAAANNKDLREIVKQTIHEMLAAPAPTSTQADLASKSPAQHPSAPSAAPHGQMDLPLDQPPVAGARKARDGRWYLEDPNRAGKFLLVG